MMIRLDAIRNLLAPLERKHQDYCHAHTTVRHLVHLGSPAEATRILVVTKWRTVHDIVEPRLRDGYAYFAYPTILTPGYRKLILSAARAGRTAVRVVTDLSPTGLTMYLSLAAESDDMDVRVEFAGIDDAWVALGPGSLQGGGRPPRTLIQMSEAERDHFALLEKLPYDWEGLLGEDSVALLREGVKLELEGATNPIIHRPSHSARMHDHVFLRPLRRWDAYLRRSNGNSH